MVLKHENCPDMEFLNEPSLGVLDTNTHLVQQEQN